MALDPINYDPNWDRTGPAPPGYRYVPGTRILEPNNPNLPPMVPLQPVPVAPKPGDPNYIPWTPGRGADGDTGFFEVRPPRFGEPGYVLQRGDPGYVPGNWVRATPYDPNVRNFFGNPDPVANQRNAHGWAVPQGWQDFLGSKGLWAGTPYEPGQTGYNTFRNQSHQLSAVQQAFYNQNPDVAYSKVVDAFGGVDSNFGRYAQQHFKQLFDRYNVATTSDPSLQWTDYLNQNADKLRGQYDAGSRTERGLSTAAPYAPNGGRWLG